MSWFLDLFLSRSRPRSAAGPLPQSLAEWERWCEGKPFVKQQLENLENSFHARAFEMRFGNEPTRLAFGALLILRNQAVKTSQRFWGERATEEPEHAKLQHDIHRELQRIEARLNEAEMIRAHEVQTARSATVAIDPPGPKAGATPIEDLMWQLALEILNGPTRPPKRGRITRLSEAVEAKIKALGYKHKDTTIQKSIRPSLKEWEATHGEN